MPRLAAPRSRSSSQPLPEGGFEPTGKTLFSASGRCSPLIRRPLKMPREAAAGWRAPRGAHWCGRSGWELVVTCGAWSPGRESGHPASPTRCPASLRKDRPGTGSTSPKPPFQVFSPSPFTRSLNLEIQRFKAGEHRWRSSGLVPCTAGLSPPPPRPARSQRGLLEARLIFPEICRLFI